MIHDQRPRPSRAVPLFTVLALSTTAGCGLVTSAPAGPLQSAGTVQLSAAAVLDATVAQVVTTTGRSEHPVSLDAAMGFPALLGGRVALTDWADVAGLWGLSGGGGELRVGARPGGGLPWALSVSWLTGALAPFELDDRLRDQRREALRLELYPRLFAQTQRPGTATHAILAVGYSYGLRYHALNPRDDEILQFVDTEHRLEGAAGVEWRTPRAFLSLVAMPYLVLSGTAPEITSCGIGHCEQVTQDQLVTTQQSFGASLNLTLGVSIGRL
jgi:hypothetical protein